LWVEHVLFEQQAVDAGRRTTAGVDAAAGVGVDDDVPASRTSVSGPAPGWIATLVE
jgi:hypothetical protein